MEKRMFLNVAVDLLEESKTNPRKIIDQEKQKELTDSIKEKGVLTPVLIRPIEGNGKYELVHGSRRLRAVKSLGWETIPAVALTLSDEDTMEAQLIENLQREDLHPMDEAEGFERLIKRFHYTTADVAVKTGKSESFVLHRMKLLSLISEIREAFVKGKINPTHALLLGRLQPEDQKTAWKDYLKGREQNITHHDLKAWIENHLYLDLASAGFDKKDETIVPGAGSCVACLKRTGANQLLFPDIAKKDICTDRTCFQMKVNTHIKREEEKAKKESGEELLKLSAEYYNSKAKEKGILLSGDYRVIGKKDPKCEHIKKGILVDGRDRGKVLEICREKKCKTHGSIGRYQKTPAEKEREKKEKLERKEKIETRERVVKQILEKVDDNPRPEIFNFIVFEVYEAIWHERKKEIVEWLGLKPVETQWGGKDYDAPVKKYVGGANRKDCYRLLAMCALSKFIDPSVGYDKERFIPSCKEIGIDPQGKISVEERKEEKKNKPKGKSKTGTVKTAARRKAATGRKGK